MEPSASPVVLTADVLERYRRFSLYNSPYPAHDEGRAIDLYPATNAGISPVAGEVLDTRTVRAPEKPYAVDHDYLILIDTGEYVARILHVDPAIKAGDVVAVGDSLGEMVRSGFFAPWVDNHVHLGFRTHDQNPHRASGSLPVVADVPVTPLPWDGRGVVREVGETYVVLDAPTHPDPGGRFAGIAADDGETVLDGGLSHYDGGGAFGAGGESVSLLGTDLGVPSADGRTLAWSGIEVRANDAPVVGLSLFVARDSAFGAKLVCRPHEFAVDDEVCVSLHRPPVAGDEG